MKFQKLLFLILLAALISCQQQATSEKLSLETRLNQLLENFNQEGKYNGALLLAKDGKILYHQSHGLEDAINHIPFHKNSSFRLASVSKQFICMGILILKEEGKLNIDDPTKNYLPELPYEGTTIRHLMTHTSGLPDYITLLDTHWDGGSENTDRKTAYNQDVLDMFIKYRPPIEFEPGEKWSYSNSAYVLLGLIIEKVSGQSIQEFIESRIFAPLDMQDSQAFSTDSTFEVEHQVIGYYVENGDTLLNDWNFLNGMVGDGGLYASARDLLRWDQALYTEKLISKATLAEAFEPVVLNDGSTYDYGFGWGINQSEDGKKIVQHSGGWVGFRTFLKREIEDRKTLIILTNHTNEYLQEVIEAIEKEVESGSSS